LTTLRNLQDLHPRFKSGLTVLIVREERRSLALMITSLRPPIASVGDGSRMLCRLYVVAMIVR
jgi:hypothetical protein